MNQNIEDIRKKAKERRERDMVHETLRNKQKKNIETLKNGLDISNLAINMDEMIKNEKNKGNIKESS
ncbi:MAG: hypothetical protein ABEK36_04240 [Candidatus Aenigmatarchaeota archaeon]